MNFGLEKVNFGLTNWSGPLDVVDQRITMKETLDRSELRRMQREQERERRRIRDRQRRQSMTVEQRERHLARRRRNYQLRRLRAENAKVDFQSNQISNEQQHEAVSDAQQVTQGENLSLQPLQYSDCKCNLFYCFFRWPAFYLL